MRRPVFLLLRMCFACFVLLTSAYCLLAYIPFTYQQVVVGGLFPWLQTFVKFHPYMYWLALILATWTILPDLANPKTRVLVKGFLVVFALAGIGFLAHPLLSSLPNDTQSLVWSVVTLLPLLWLAAIDWLGHGERLTWSDPRAGEEHQIFLAALLAGLFLWVVYAGIAYVRSSFGWGPQLGWPAWSISLEWSLTCHLLVFALVFFALDFVVALARLFDVPARAEFLLSMGLMAVLFWIVVRFVVFRPLSFSGFRADGMAFVFAASLTAFLSGLNVRMVRDDERPMDSGLKLLFLPMRPLRRASGLDRAWFILMIPGVAYYLALEAAGMDWGFLLQKLAVAFIWVLVFATFYTILPSSRTTGNTALIYGAAVAILVGFVTLSRAQGSTLATLKGADQPDKLALDEYADYDVSFRLARDFAFGSKLGPAARSAPQSQFYAFLAENTDIPRSTYIPPRPVQMVDHWSLPRGSRPNIFIFVIDSLRRDYVSAYNPAVTFTPSIGSFAQDSIVLKNAFTQYGGTALSEPCIWAGAMLLHQEYTTPFYPMNALQKLLEAEKYECYVSKDNILRIMLGPSPSFAALDQGVGTMELNLCRTLKELEGKIAQQRDRSRPIFAYAQPQNIHIAVINREGRSVPRGDHFPGFDPAVASRLERLDTCFGEFISFLKTSGLYDNSIVILTSDHGDSLGERGRMGHAYTIFPEIIHIPLIVHLPPALKASVWYNPNSLAFLADITPSLYYLLGQRPIVRNGIYGRPLFTKDPEEQAAYLRHSYLLASSYGPVYGILSDDMRLYIADGVNYRNYFCQLTGGAAGTCQPAGDQAQEQYQPIIRDDILAIDHFYGFHPEAK